MIKRKRILIKGIVQGVGFRPFVFALAASLNVKGLVANTSSGVLIDAEGKEEDVTALIEKIKASAPKNSSITSVALKDLKQKGYKDFKITESRKTRESGLLVTPDLSICDSCRAELFDPANRRKNYPFITCVDCGPRFSIIERTPYDRENNSMNAFKMCTACEWEFVNPAERRFHSETNSCELCGPRLFLYTRNRKKIEAEDPLHKTSLLLKEGKIIAIKGLGGFHLMCDAENDSAVREMRKRKGRVKKPFALLSENAEAAKKFCIVSEEEEKALMSPERPIVLLKKLRKTSISAEVSPELDTFGVMAAYAPLQLILLKTGFLALVATSVHKYE